MPCLPLLHHPQKHIQLAAICFSPCWGVWLITHCISSPDTWISVPCNYQLLIGSHCQIGLLSQHFLLAALFSASAWFPLPTSRISLMASTQVWSWPETIKCLQYQILSSCILPLSHYSSRMESRWFNSEFFCITAVFSKISYFSMLHHCRIEHLF